MSLAVELAGLQLKNPLIAASGTFGYGVEYEGVIDLARLGGIVSKGLYLEPRDGAPVPRIAETPSGLLNAIGLQGIGIRAFVEDVLPRLRQHDTALFVNVCGDTVEEYAEVARVCDGAAGIAGLEINISCPNVKQGGMAFGGDPRMTHAVVAAVRAATRLPVIPKLSPNVADITVFARAAADAGADALSCINTLLGLAVDVETRRPRLGYGTGGLSGPAIRPVAVRMAWQAAGADAGPFVEYEALLNRFLAGSRTIGVCLYRQAESPARLVRDVLRTHPVAVLGDQVCPNLFYEPPEMVLGRPSAEDRVSWMIAQLLRERASTRPLCEQPAQIGGAIRLRVMRPLRCRKVSS